MGCVSVSIVLLPVILGYFLWCLTQNNPAKQLPAKTPCREQLHASLYFTRLSYSTEQNCVVLSKFESVSLLKLTTASPYTTIIPFYVPDYKRIVQISRVFKQ